MKIILNLQLSTIFLIRSRYFSRLPKLQDMADDSFIWQRLTTQQHWVDVACGELIERGFRAGRQILEFQLVDCSETCRVDIDSMNIWKETDDAHQPLRRLSDKSEPDAVYQWQNVDTWEFYNTDQCEMIHLAEMSQRKELVLYIGETNTPYTLSLGTSVQTNMISGHVRWFRKSPRPTSSPLSPSVISTADESLIYAIPTGRFLNIQDSVTSVIDSAVTITSAIGDENDDVCSICLDGFDHENHQESCMRQIKLSGCTGHYYHPICISKELHRTGKCAVCCRSYVVQTGDQPDSGTMRAEVVHHSSVAIAGYGKEVDTIVIEYYFPAGVQGQEHAHPGT